MCLSVSLSGVRPSLCLSVHIPRSVCLSLPLSASVSLCPCSPLKLLVSLAQSVFVIVPRGGDVSWETLGPPLGESHKHSGLLCRSRVTQCFLPGLSDHRTSSPELLLTPRRVTAALGRGLCLLPVCLPSCLSSALCICVPAAVPTPVPGGSHCVHQSPLSAEGCLSPLPRSVSLTSQLSIGPCAFLCRPLSFCHSVFFCLPFCLSVRSLSCFTSPSL